MQSYLLGMLADVYQYESPYYVKLIKNKNKLIRI